MWTRGHELKYWFVNGCAKGTQIYENYIKSFDLDDYDFEKKSIADIGCGPFGGVFCNHPEVKAIPIDILAEDYNKLKYASEEIVYGDLSKTLPFEDNSFDYVICTNTIDHIPYMQNGFDEILRILKVGGTAFIHVHMRTEEQLNKAHIHAVTKDEVLNKYASSFSTMKYIIDTDWVNDREDRNAIYMVLGKG